LAERVLELQSGLPVLFVSGHSERVAGRKRIAPGGAAVMENPFTTTALLRHVRAAMTPDTSPLVPT
jgi:FixJ family two-component response regulator